jgi:hypothetical protein
LPRYFFDVTDSSGAHTDEVGLDLPDMDAAIMEARRALADMTRESLAERNPANLRIHIRDGADGPVNLVVSMTTERPNETGH